MKLKKTLTTFLIKSHNTKTKNFKNDTMHANCSIASKHVIRFFIKIGATGNFRKYYFC